MLETLIDPGSFGYLRFKAFMSVTHFRQLSRSQSADKVTRTGERAVQKQINRRRTRIHINQNSDSPRMKVTCDLNAKLPLAAFAAFGLRIEAVIKSRLHRPAIGPTLIRRSVLFEPKMHYSQAALGAMCTTIISRGQSRFSSSRKFVRRSVNYVGQVASGGACSGSWILAVRPTDKTIYAAASCQHMKISFGMRLKMAPSGHAICASRGEMQLGGWRRFIHRTCRR
jgi:hypothetical protein